MSLESILDIVEKIFDGAGPDKSRLEYCTVTFTPESLQDLDMETYNMITQLNGAGEIPTLCVAPVCKYLGVKATFTKRDDEQIFDCDSTGKTTMRKIIEGEQC